MTSLVPTESLGTRLSCDLLMPFMANPIACQLVYMHGKCNKLGLVDLGICWCMHFGTSHYVAEEISNIPIVFFSNSCQLWYSG